jgi:hypothetical protein
MSENFSQHLETLCEIYHYSKQFQSPSSTILTKPLKFRPKGSKLINPIRNC